MNLYCYNVAYRVRGSKTVEHEARQTLASNEQEARLMVAEQAISYRGSAPEEVTLIYPPAADMRALTTATCVVDPLTANSASASRARW